MPAQGQSQREVDAILDRRRVLPVEFFPDAPPPTAQHPYARLEVLKTSGFAFTVREFLHALGCKLASLPSNDVDAALSAAWLYFHVLDHDRPDLGLRREVFADTDLLRNRSNEMGVGVMSLLAYRTWGLPWDQLTPIRGRGKRFDYRGDGAGLRAIFEAKGTTVGASQPAQIRHGIKKKKAHHQRGEKHDIELIVSTHIAPLSVGSRVVLADPPIDVPDDTFGPQAGKVYFLRHWARAMQFVGVPQTARALYNESNEILGPARWQWRYRHRGYGMGNAELDLVDTDDGPYLGSWRRSWIPTDSARRSRYRHLAERETRLTAKLAEVTPRVEIFQGAHQRIVERLVQGEPFDVVELMPREMVTITGRRERIHLSRFPDGTALAARPL